MKVYFQRQRHYTIIIIIDVPPFLIPPAKFRENLPIYLSQSHLQTIAKQALTCFKNCRNVELNRNDKSSRTLNLGTPHTHTPHSPHANTHTPFIIHTHWYVYVYTSIIHYSLPLAPIPHKPLLIHSIFFLRLLLLLLLLLHIILCITHVRISMQTHTNALAQHTQPHENNTTMCTPARTPLGPLRKRIYIFFDSKPSMRIQTFRENSEFFLSLLLSLTYIWLLSRSFSAIPCGITTAFPLQQIGHISRDSQFFR